MKKIKVYTLTDEGTAPKCIGTMKGEAGESLADLRLRLEEKKVLNFIFQYWDPQEDCRVVVALESLNDIEDSVFMIPAVDDHVQNSRSKRQCLEGESDVGGSRESNVIHLDMPEFPDNNTPEFPEIPADPLVLTNPASCSRISTAT